MCSTPGTPHSIRSIGRHDPALDLRRLRARPRHHDVHHRHADLRLLLAGGGEEGESPEAEGGRDDERSELAVEEGAGDLAREADLHGYPPLLCRSESGVARSPLLVDGSAVREPGRVEDDALARLALRPGPRRCRRRGRRRPPSAGGPCRRSRRRGPRGPRARRARSRGRSRRGSAATPGTSRRAKRPARRPEAAGRSAFTSKRWVVGSPDGATAVTVRRERLRLAVHKRPRPSPRAGAWPRPRTRRSPAARGRPRPRSR